MTGSLAPPPPYGSEQGSILLEGGREGVREGMGGYIMAGYQGHGRTISQQIRLGRNQPTSPGPQRSPTDISLAQFSIDSNENDVGEGTSTASGPGAMIGQPFGMHGLGFHNVDAPPEYESPQGSPQLSRRTSDDDSQWNERARLLNGQEPPIPSYDAAVADTPQVRVRSATETSRSTARRVQ